MASLAILCFFVASITITSGRLTDSLSQLEQHRIILKLQQSHNDLESAYYAATGIEALGKTANNPKQLCQLAIDQVQQNNVESVFQYSQIVKSLTCKNGPKVTFSGLINDATDSTTYAKVIIAMVNLGMEVDSATVKKFVAAAKENDTPASAASAFYAASLLPATADVKVIVSMVEDIVAQADEVDGNILQFEGGLSVTSEVVRGILLLSNKKGSALLKEDQILKFASYFVSRKYVYSLKDIHHLVVALNALANNKHQVPVVVSVFKSSLITKDSPVLKVRVTNVLDQSIPDASVSAQSLVTADDSVTLFEHKPFTKTAEKDDYIVIDGDVARGYIAAHSFYLDVMAANPSRGMLKCNIAAKIKKDTTKRFVLGGKYIVRVKVLARIMVEGVQIAVGDKDSTSLKTTSLVYPDKLLNHIDADSHQKIVMTFNLKDLNSGNLVTAHQTFIRLVSEETQQEIFFVAEPDSDDHYKFTLDVAATGKDSFNNLSGKYKMSLIIGDASMQVPISWTLGDVTLSFTGESKTTKRQERITKPEPVIQHMFRVPEQRPAKIVTTAFTALVLSPLLVMFAMWAKVGANLSNFKFSLPALLFHVGLAGIFVLYYLFWTQYNMFHTLKLLVVIGGMTFLGGNKMLADMAAAKYKS